MHFATPDHRSMAAQSPMIVLRITQIGAKYNKQIVHINAQRLYDSKSAQLLLQLSRRQS